MFCACHYQHISIYKLEEVSLSLLHLLNFEMFKISAYFDF